MYDLLTKIEHDKLTSTHNISSISYTSERVMLFLYSNAENNLEKIHRNEFLIWTFYGDIIWSYNIKTNHVCVKFLEQNLLDT